MAYKAAWTLTPETQPSSFKQGSDCAVFRGKASGDSERDETPGQRGWGTHKQIMGGRGGGSERDGSGGGDGDPGEEAAGLSDSCPRAYGDERGRFPPVSRLNCVANNGTLRGS